MNLCLILLHLTITIPVLAIVTKSNPNHTKSSPLELTPRFRIVGGRLANANEYPPIVSLSKWLRPSYLTSFCGGSIIHLQWILTAATCVIHWISDPSLRNDIIIRAGILNLVPQQEPEPGAANYSVLHAEIHPYFDGTFEFSDNVALVKINGAFRDNQIATVLSTRDNEFIPIHALVTSYGWGLTDPADMLSDSYSLLKVDNEISPKYCSDPNETEPFRSERRHQQICVASFHDRGICEMDTGGPLVFGDDKILLGVASYYDEPCGSHRGRYARVSHYIPWIEKTIGAKLRKRSSGVVLKPSAFGITLLALLVSILQFFNSRLKFN